MYDRFGRLAFGSDTLPKDVLEYVVFEKYLTSPYSSWRVHEKVIPPWSTAKTPVIRSYVLPKPLEVADEEFEKNAIKKFTSDDSHLDKIKD